MLFGDGGDAFLELAEIILRFFFYELIFFGIIRIRVY